MNQSFKNIAALSLALMFAALVCARPSAANMCPFCSAVALTFAEQLDSNDVVVVAKLLEVPPPSEDPNADFPKGKFEIVQVIKGEKLVATGMEFRTQLVGSYPTGQKFLVMGVDPPKIAWTTPMKASDRVFKYLHDIRQLPANGTKRLMFFQEYFEDAESMLAFDAYDEFARASYADLVAMKDQMNHDRLIKWISDPETSPNRRRLYFTMLGVCGTKDDLKLLEKFITSENRADRTGLDALIACYLTLTGDQGVDLIEKTFLADPAAEYIDVRDAVSALRFLGTETKSVSQDRIVAAVRHVLDRPKMADMVIADLARWEDWSVMDRLVQMFKDADDESNWLRVPVITYLRACPKPEAKKYIEELAKIDPDSIRRADFFLGGFGDDEEEEEEEEEEEADQKVNAQDAKNTTDSNESQDAKDSKTRAPKEKSELREKSPVGQLELPPAHVVLKFPVDQDRSLRQAKTEAKTEAKPNLAASQSIELAQRKSDKKRTQSSATMNRSSSVFVSNPVTESLASRRSMNSTNAEPEVIAQSLPVAATELSPNLTWLIIFVPMGMSVVIFLLLWSVVNGWFERLIF